MWVRVCCDLYKHESLFNCVLTNMLARQIHILKYVNIMLAHYYISIGSSEETAVVLDLIELLPLKSLAVSRSKIKERTGRARLHESTCAARRTGVQARQGATEIMHSKGHKSERRAHMQRKMHESPRTARDTREHAERTCKARSTRANA